MGTTRTVEVGDEVTVETESPYTGKRLVWRGRVVSINDENVTLHNSKWGFQRTFYRDKIVRKHYKKKVY